MERILISARDVNIGGVQKSLVEFLKKLEPLIEKQICCVDLVLLNDSGSFKTQLSDKIKIIKPNNRFLKFGYGHREAKKVDKLFFIRTLSALWSKLFSNKFLLKMALKRQQHLGDYDVAISYATTINKHSLYAGWSELILQKCDAKKKIVYIHNDYVNSALNNKNTYKILKRFDKIWFVSKSCEENFLTKYPEFKGFTDYLYNFQTVDVIIEKSKEKQCEYDKDKFNIVSVSRLSEEKAHLRSLNAFKKIVDDGFNIHWNIVGDGPKFNEIQEKIKLLGLEKNVTLYGNQTNPYPYIKNADLFYLGSYHEAAPMVYGESMILGCPVLTTNTCSSKEMIPPEYGYICENSEEGIYNGLKEVLENPKLVAEKRENLKSFKYDNDAIVKKLLDLIKEK